jgi:general stress protein YciG
MEQEKSHTSGFGSMDAEKQKEIARKGGMAAHRKGTAHEFTPEEARNAGRKGGERVSANRNHMVEIGRLGGRKSAERRRTTSKSADDKTPAGAGESRSHAHVAEPESQEATQNPGE